MSDPRPLTTAEWQHAVDSHGLVAGPAYAYGLPDGTIELAVHIATGDDLTEDARQQLHAELHTAIDDTFRRVLGRTPGRSGGMLIARAER
ncbi:hypothetical protein [Streptomyces phytophilus]|uniref:hypothetical protein n=1 Tax=Streptomyces phytophilus TaxID=722715 RepID=UPI0015F0B1E7|nr:hypothetical protein [Streptomyces phytophilus]